MCRNCLHEFEPDVGTMVKSVGCDMVNFRRCAQCQVRALPKSVDVERTTEEEDDLHIERVIYSHICSNCNHVIAEHFYEFTASQRGDQEFTMECHLCGDGSDRVNLSSVQPLPPSHSSVDTKSQSPEAESKSVYHESHSFAEVTITQIKTTSKTVESIRRVVEIKSRESYHSSQNDVVDDDEWDD